MNFSGPKSNVSSTTDFFSRVESQKKIVVEDEEEDTSKEIAPIDFYGVLNATDLEIKNSYKRLCMTFHPDKHGEDSKEFAEHKFHLIQKAYDVLNDPNKRHIYDLYGEQALKDSWDLSAPLDKEQIRQEYERRANLKKQLEEQNMVKSKGEISIAFDATRVFQYREKGSLLDVLDLDDLPEIQHAMVVHSWETRVNDETSLTLRGNVVTKNGLGSGNISLTTRHVVSPMLWGEVTGAIGDQNAVGLKIVKNFDSDTFSTFNLNCNNVTNIATTAIMFGRKVADHTTGFITYKPTLHLPWFDTGANNSSCMLGLVHDIDKVQSGVDIQAGLQQSFVSIYQARPIGSIKAKVQMTIATGSGLSLAISGDRRLDKSTRIGVGVECASAQGVTFRIKLNRLGQRLTIPILISNQLDFRLAALTFVVPVAGYIAIDKSILGPWRKAREQQRLETIRKENAETLEKRRMEAEQACMLLADSIARKLEAEESRDGLVVISALYGKLPPSTLESVRVLSPQGIQELAASIKAQFKFLKSAALPVSHKQEYIDVTIPVQALVSNGQLHISGGHSKSNLIGFYDPCFGEKKQLRITYQFQGRLHQVTVGDKMPVAAPLRANSI
ncbi:hypothetical protein HDV01_002485 [Terramyces sp. JEL0728]|nr:hypothetical protein HDV01_002485 [Terramyces sp. JEL0728]